MQMVRVQTTPSSYERGFRPLVEREHFSANSRLVSMIGRGNEMARQIMAERFSAVNVDGRSGLTGPEAPTSAGDASPLVEGIRTEMVGTYQLDYPTNLEFWKQIFFNVVPVRSSYYQYTYPGTPPYIARQPKGTAPKTGNFKYYGNRIDVFAYAARIEMNLDDLADDQTGSIYTQARRLSQNAATLPNRLAIQLLTGTVDTDLLPYLPICDDGAGLLSTTDGDGKARFGRTGGNIITLAGTTPADIVAWLQAVIAAFPVFKDTQSEPLINPEYVKNGIMLIHGPAIEPEVRAALNQRTLFTEAIQGGNVVGAANPTNVLIDAGVKIQTHSDPRITDSKLYACLMSPEVPKPAIWGERMPLYETYADEPVSDRVRDTNQAYLQVRTRVAAGYGLPYGIIGSAAA